MRRGFLRHAAAFLCAFSASGIDRRRHQSLTVIAFCGKSHQKQEDPPEKNDHAEHHDHHKGKEDDLYDIAASPPAVDQDHQSHNSADNGSDYRCDDISCCRRCLGIYEKAGVEHERYRKAAVENDRIHPAEYLIPVLAKRQIYEAADDREIKKGLEPLAFEKMK